MSYLLDANVISEASKPAAHSGLKHWLGTRTHEELFISVITVTEIRSGIDTLPAGRRRQGLEGWFRDQLLARYSSRLLEVDLAVSDEAGRLFAGEKRRGRNPDLADALVAATASVHGLVLATRNVKHFSAMGIRTFNPFSSGL